MKEYLVDEVNTLILSLKYLTFSQGAVVGLSSRGTDFPW